jgi:hypothetical protein
LSWNEVRKSAEISPQLAAEISRNRQARYGAIAPAAVSFAAVPDIAMSRVRHACQRME